MKMPSNLIWILTRLIGLVFQNLSFNHDTKVTFGKWRFLYLVKYFVNVFLCQLKINIVLIVNYHQTKALRVE